MRGVGSPYKRAEDLDGYDAIVIGSGIGGLGAAALLARFAGMKVLVLERHYEAGGYTHTFRRPGFEWDVGVHYVGSVHPKTMLGKFLGLVTDGTLSWADMGPVYDKIIVKGETYEFPKGRKNLQRRLCEYFPDEASAIEAYFGMVREAAMASGPFFLQKILPRSVDGFVGARMRQNFERFASRTTREVLEELTDNQRLISVLTGQWGDYGLPPAESSFAMHAMLVTHYIHGAGYPVGGSSRIAAAIVPVIASSGGKVLIRAEVKEIIVEGGRAAGVRMEDDKVIRAPIIISGAGVFNTFQGLVDAESRREFGLERSMGALRPSAAHLCLYLGLHGSAEELELPRHNLWIYPRERHEDALTSASLEGDLPLIYISFPSAKDPEFESRFPGKSTIELITVASYDWFQEWENKPWKKRGDEYEALKASMTEKLLAVLYDHVPKARGKIAHAELSTPLSTRHFAGYQRGELYGLEHSPARFQDTLLRPATPIPGLFLTGQDIATCGVAGALFGGILAAAAVILRSPGVWPSTFARILQSRAIDFATASGRPS